MQQPKNWGESEGWEEERWGLCQMVCGGGGERGRERKKSEVPWILGGEGRWKVQQWREHEKWGRWEGRSKNWGVTFGTRICQNVEINSMAPNQGSYRQRSEGWMQTGGIKRKFHWQGGTDVFLILNICPCIVERKSSDDSRSNGPGRVRTSSRDAD